MLNNKICHRKQFINFCLLLLFNTSIFSQVLNNTHAKYWYYRYRLKNDFLLIGDCQGCSLPINQRSKSYVNNRFPLPNPSDPANIPGGFEGDIKWGDVTIVMGWYLAVLGSEYKLLSDYGENLDSLKRELFYALEAINRLDYYAETYIDQPSQPSLNGFFIRDDVPFSFLCDDPLNPNSCSTPLNSKYNVFKHFNSGKIVYPLNGSFADNYLNKTNITLGSGFADFEYRDYSSLVCPRRTPTEETIDQVYNLLIGLAVVSKLVDNNAYYSENGSPKYFKDGKIFFKEEARKITYRIVSYMRNNGWLIYHPALHDCIWGTCDSSKANPPCHVNFNCGANGIGFSYGELAAWNFIQSGTSPPQYLFASSRLLPLLSVGGNDITTTFSFSSIFRNIGRVSPITTAFFHNLHDIDFIFALTSVSSNLYKTINPLSAVSFYKNNTQKILDHYCKKYDREIYPLIHAVLHGYETSINDEVFETLLRKGPCQGPVNYKDDNNRYFAEYEWSSPNRWISPDSRGEGLQYPEFGGELNGIDYMALYNLYYIYKGGAGMPYYTNLMDRKEQHTFPYTINIPIINFNNTYGNQQHPVEIGAFEQIETSSTLNSDAVVNFRAGDRIVLRPGFKAKAGSKSHIYLKHYTCAWDNSVSYYERIGSSDETDDTPSSYETDYGNMFLLPQSNHNPFKKIEYNYDDSLSMANNSTPLENNITIYPNPSNGQVIIEQNIGTGKLQIFNGLMQEVYNEEINQNVATLNLSHLPKGIYFVKYSTTQGNSSIQKLILR